METRRPARKQDLPAGEYDVLSNQLGPDQFYTRVRQLYQAGWTLQAIGNLWSPPKRRSTVRYWINRASDTVSVDIPLPTPKQKPKGYVSRRPVSPGINPADLARIEQLSPLARRYRSKMASNSPQAIANEELTIICVRLHQSNVTVRELAAAAGVTYRAMSRRLGK